MWWPPPPRQPRVGPGWPCSATREKKEKDCVHAEFFLEAAATRKITENATAIWLANAGGRGERVIHVRWSRLLCYVVAILARVVKKKDEGRAPFDDNDQDNSSHGIHVHERVPLSPLRPLRSTYGLDQKRSEKFRRVTRIRNNFQPTSSFRRSPSS